MNALRRFIEPFFFQESDCLDRLSGLAYWRQLTFFLFAIPFVFVSPPIMLYGAFRFFVEGMPMQGALEAVMAIVSVLLVTWRRMPVRYRSLILVALLYSLGLLLLIVVGPFGAGLACIIGVMAISGSLFPFRDVLRIVGINAMVLVLLTILVITGALDQMRISAYGNAWLINLLVGMVFSCGLPLQIQVIYNGLEAQFRESNTAREQAETSRLAAELAREQAETSRLAAEQAREQAEQARVRVEQALEETDLARREAEAASAAKSQFLSNMAHEIRTPMNGVIGMIQLMELTSLDEEQQEYMKLFHTSADALLGIINDILDHSRIEAGRMVFETESFAIEAMLGDLRVLFRPAFEAKGLALTTEMEPDVPERIIGDRFRIRQILMNLVGNAHKFTEQGGVHLHVRSGARGVDGRVPLSFEVIDTGIGIPAAEQERIFDSFHQVDGTNTRQYGGTGLGLAISRGIAEQMGGTMCVESVVGHGSTFRFQCAFEVAGAEAGRDAGGEAEAADGST